jgi:Protein of unknown function (DUF2808)
MLSKRPFRLLLTSLCVAGSLVSTLPTITSAQSNPGFSFVWGDGPGRKQQLGYVLDYGTPGHSQDRYRLKLGRQNVAIDSITITYPNYYDGTFNEKRVTLQEAPKNKFLGFGKTKQIEVSSVKLDKDNRLIEIVPKEPIPSGVPVEVVLSDVQNPRSGGMYYFNAYINSPGDVPLRRYLGTWILSLFRS